MNHLMGRCVVGLAFAGGGALACASITEHETFDEADASGTDASTAEVSLPPPNDPVTDAGSRTFDGSDEAVVCAESPCAVELVAGESHYCARMSDGTVRCWGNASRGAIGETDGGVAVVTVANLPEVVQIGAGGATTCARSATGQILCWGANDKGQLGLGVDAAPTVDGNAHPTPAAVALSVSADRVDVGQASACAVLETGRVVCWGDNRSRQLGREGSEPIGLPAEVDIDPSPVIRTAMTPLTGFAKTADGTLLSWGDSSPVTGRESSFWPDPTPAPIVQLTGVTHFSAWTRKDYAPVGQACAIADGKLYCWGDSENAAVCTGVPDTEIYPAEINVHDSAYPQQVAVSDYTTCVRFVDGTIQCCGDNRFGQLGAQDGGNTRQPTLVLAPSLSGHAVHVATSDRSVCALLQGGTVRCWGSNQFGELGQGTQDEEPHPTSVVVRLR